jgi:hypothetical protein
MKDKLIKSALIALGGAALTIVPLLTAEVSDWLTTSNPIDWRTPLAMAVAALGTWIVNTIRELIKNH